MKKKNSLIIGTGVIGSYLDYKKYFSINKRYFRANEIKTMIGSNKNYNALSKKFNFKIKLVEKN